MPVVKTYKKGSIIYFDGESKNNSVFLLKSGLCSGTKFSVESQVSERTKLVEGEFFGIKAALGVPMRDETIGVVSDSVVYVFTPAEFEVIIKKNISIIFKMLKAFSNELRRIHHAIENVLNKNNKEVGLGTSGKLFAIGEYYIKMKKHNQAKYAFECYLKHYPQGDKKDSALDYLKRLENSSNLSDGEELEETPIEEEVDFCLCETEASYEALQIVDPLTQKYAAAAKSFAEKSLASCATLINTILTENADKTQTSEVFERVHLMNIRLVFYKQDYAQCIELAKNFVKNYKSSPLMLYAMLCIGESYDKLNNPVNAAAVFKKIKDSIKSDAYQELKSHVENRLLELEG